MLTENSLLEEDNTFHLVRPADDIDEVKSKRGSMKDKAMTKAITEIYLTRLLSVKVTPGGQTGGTFGVGGSLAHPGGEMVDDMKTCRAVKTASLLSCRARCSSS